MAIFMCYTLLSVARASPFANYLCKHKSFNLYYCNPLHEYSAPDLQLSHVNFWQVLVTSKNQSILYIKAYYINEFTLIHQSMLYKGEFMHVGINFATVWHTFPCYFHITISHSTLQLYINNIHFHTDKRLPTNQSFLVHYKTLLITVNNLTFLPTTTLRNCCKLWRIFDKNVKI